MTILPIGFAGHVLRSYNCDYVTSGNMIVMLYLRFYNRQNVTTEAHKIGNLYLIQFVMARE